MTDLDILIDKIHKYHKSSDINDLCSKILKKSLYFFVIDDGSFPSVTEIIWTNKERPISIPTILNEGKMSGVLYVSKKQAIKLKGKNFRLAQMPGINALEMMLKNKEIDEVVIQGSNAFLSMSCSEIKGIIDRFA
jgi:hypothetical protein